MGCGGGNKWGEGGMRLLRTVVASRCGCAWSSALLHPGVGVLLRCIRKHQKNLFQTCWSSSFFLVTESKNGEQPVMGQCKSHLTLARSSPPITWHWRCSQKHVESQVILGLKATVSSLVCILWVALLTLPPFCTKMAVPLSCSPSYLALQLLMTLITSMQKIGLIYNAGNLM